MAFGPIRLRHQIVNHIKGPGSQQVERVIKVIKFPWPRIRENEIKLPAAKLVQKICAIVHMKNDARIFSEMSPGNLDVSRLAVHGDQDGSSIHSIEDPRG